MPRRPVVAAVAVVLVLCAGFGAQAGALSQGRSLGGLGMIAFAALAAGAWLGLSRRA